MVRCFILHYANNYTKSVIYNETLKLSSSSQLQLNYLKTEIEPVFAKGNMVAPSCQNINIKVS